MKLYKYVFNKYGKTKVTLEELEAEEKPKTYAVKSGWQQRINKELIGVTSGYSNDTVILLEKDFEKARTIYLAKLQSEYLRKQEEVQKLKKVYEEICDLESVE